MIRIKLRKWLHAAPWEPDGTQFLNFDDTPLEGYVTVFNADGVPLASIQLVDGWLRSTNPSRDRPYPMADGSQRNDVH